MQKVANSDPVPTRATGAMFKFSLAMAVSRVTIPASIVTVRSFAGETEDEALERHGIDRHQPECGVTFVNLT